ncbi:TetR family transcriptional regulator [Paenibacillus mucilaginosus 3016]|uniref:TetR family transcriptional regulator n=2 Tax=Paenibacillus mucilaginosus TaxID=61624 RepID=H6NHH9_9BACL|nr:TetR/AcrR family transcriptional regulator [Paenibacillus mucilaginosus]AFC29576.1 TetR family transcriptional regulator [Paenibacillus mucilaginosus 3016]AFH61750.1 TetR family transcriptional regulator [Paenibacillus mucilaginosus K02]WFA18262.1 TetR/AcrR family transcriptional regulator [Paenibacillus mucilaginosus]
MPRNTAKDQELRKERCSQILSAAVELFAKQGLTSTKISDIAKKAGMSHGLVYNYFRSKEEIYLSLLDMNMNVLENILLWIHSLDRTPKGKLERLIDKFRSEPWDEALFYQMFVDQIFSSDTISEELKASVRGKMSENLDILAGIFAEGQAAGQFRAGPPRELAFYFLTIAHARMISESQGFKICDNRTETWDAILDFFCVAEDRA